MKGRILIVDDEPSVCKVIARVLASRDLSPEIANSGEEALALMGREAFDAVILDITMDDMDGFAVLAEIRKTNLDVPVVILSGNNENYSMLLGLESGADDYMTKPFDPTFLAAKIQALLRRERQKQRAAPALSALHAGALQYDPAARKLFRDGEEIPLSGKEHALIRLFMENPGRVFTKEDLYSLVWSDGKPPEKNDENTIMVHINRLRRKIEQDPKDPRHIQTVWGVGYRMDG